MFRPVVVVPPSACGMQGVEERGAVRGTSVVNGGGSGLCAPSRPSELDVSELDRGRPITSCWVGDLQPVDQSCRVVRRDGPGREVPDPNLEQVPALADAHVVRFDRGPVAVTGDLSSVEAQAVLVVRRDLDRAPSGLHSLEPLLEDHHRGVFSERSLRVFQIQFAPGMVRPQSKSVTTDAVPVVSVGTSSTVPRRHSRRRGWVGRWRLRGSSRSPRLRPRTRTPGVR